MGIKYYKEGKEEIVRSFNKNKFIKNAHKIIPEISVDDLIPAPSGACAQGLKSGGSLVDDFLS